jgi:hypothetical protein
VRLYVDNNPSAHAIAGLLSFSRVSIVESDSDDEARWRWMLLWTQYLAIPIVLCVREQWLSMT